jgi:galactosylceramidase
LPDPFTLAGDLDWTDYAVAADVRFLTSAPAVVMGRIDSADVFQDGKALWPSGYILRVKPDGGWELLSAQFKKPVVTLAAGVAGLDRSQWHRLQLRFRGAEIVASLDGKPLATVDNSTHTHGMFALGTEWNRIQFDNLEVKQ